MESLTLLFNGIVASITDPALLFPLVVAVVFGLLIGALPGLGPTAGVALTLPVAVGFPPTVALAIMGGVYYGAMFGGAITAILLGIPGDAPAVMTVVDGYPLAKRGEAGRALGLAIFSSFTGGLAGLIGLTMLADITSRYALLFGPTEMAALMVLALSLVSILGTTDKIKSFMALGLGLWLGTIGLDRIMGGPRFTFGTLELMDGLDFPIIAVGMFGLGAMFTGLEEKIERAEAASYSYRSMLPRPRDFIAVRKALGLGSVIGFIVGVLPGAGATAATMLSYGAMKKISKTPEEFGHGALEGVAAPESANNSASFGAMVPLFTLGVPGSGTTAILLAGLLMLGLQPGPMLFQDQPEFVWNVFGTFYVGNFALVVITFFLTPILAAAIFISRGYLYSLVIGIVAYGVFSIESSVESLLVMSVFGILGYFMAKLKYPSVPLILGVVLGPLLELGVRRTLIASRGSLAVFLERPIPLFLFIITATILLLPVLSGMLKARKSALASAETDPATQTLP